MSGAWNTESEPSGGVAAPTPQEEGGGDPSDSIDITSVSSGGGSRRPEWEEWDRLSISSSSAVKDGVIESVSLRGLRKDGEDSEGDNSGEGGSARDEIANCVATVAAAVSCCGYLALRDPARSSLTRTISCTA